MKILNSCLAVFSDSLTLGVVTTRQYCSPRQTFTAFLLPQGQLSLIGKNQGEQPWNFTITWVKNDGIFPSNTCTQVHLICVNKSNSGFNVIGVSVDDRNKGDIP